MHGAYMCDDEGELDWLCDEGYCVEERVVILDEESGVEELAGGVVEE